MAELSAVQRAMLAEAQAKDPTVTEDDVRALTPAQTKQWMDRRMMSGEPPATPGALDQIGHGLKGLAGLVTGWQPGPHGVLTNLQLAQGLAQTAQNVGTTMAPLNPAMSPVESAMRMRAPGYGKAALSTAGTGLMALAPEASPLIGALAMGAGGAAQTPEEPLAGATGVLAGAGLAKGAGALGTMGSNISDFLNPTVQGQIRVAQAMQNTSGGPAALAARAASANALGKGGLIQAVDLSPELAAAGDFAAIHSPAVRAQAEAVLARRAADAGMRSAADLQAAIGNPVANNRLQTLVADRQAWANSPQGFAGWRAANPTATGSLESLGDLWKQPKVRTTVSDAQEAGLIGTDIDPAAVAKKQFDADVKMAKSKQAAWDAAKEQFDQQEADAQAAWQERFDKTRAFSTGRKGELPSDEVVMKTVGPRPASTPAELTLGPRPDIPTDVPPPSGEMMQSIKEKLDDAVGRAFKNGNGNLARRLASVRDAHVDWMEQNLPGYADLNQQYAQRMGLENAIDLGHRVTAPGFDKAELPGILNGLSKEPVPGVGTSPAQEFKMTLASHLRQAEPTAASLTPETMSASPQLSQLMQATIPDQGALNRLLGQNALETQMGKATVPSATMKSPTAAASWFSYRLPAKIAYKMGGEAYMRKMGDAMAPYLFNPGLESWYKAAGMPHAPWELPAGAAPTAGVLAGANQH